MKKIIFPLILFISTFQLYAQKEYTISITTEKQTTKQKETSLKSNEQKGFELLQQVIHYVNLHASITCLEKLNPILEDTLKKEMRKIKEETAYILAINYDACRFMKLYPDNGKKDLWDNYTTVYHITLYPDITLHPDFPSASTTKKDESSAQKKPLLATYKDDNGKWIAMGPYMTTDPYETENQALGSLFYSDSDLTFICQRGKFKIYSLNGKVEHDARDIRSALKVLGINDIPE